MSSCQSPTTCDLPFNRGEATAVEERLFLKRLRDVAPQQKPCASRERGVVNEQQKQNESQVDDGSA